MTTITTPSSLALVPSLETAWQDVERLRDAPDFVEVGEAGVAVSDAMRHQCCVQLLDDIFALVSCQRGSENRQVLMSFQSTEPWVASSMPAASSAAPSRHCASASRCDRLCKDCHAKAQELLDTQKSFPDESFLASPKFGDHSMLRSALNQQ